MESKSSSSLELEEKSLPGPPLPPGPPPACCCALKVVAGVALLCLLAAGAFALLRKKGNKDGGGGADPDPHPSQLVDYLRGTGKDPEEYTLSEVLEKSPNEILGNYYMFPWYFPTLAASESLEGAPQLTKDDVRVLCGDKEAKGNQVKLFEKVATALGFSVSKGQLSVEKSNNVDWDELTFKRITRVLSSLKTLGNEDTAKAFYEALQEARSFFLP